MSPVAKRATPAAIAVLRQATEQWPKRKKLSDGLLPSAAHLKANPNSDHNTGLAVDLTHDPARGVDCEELFIRFRVDPRVSYLIFNGKIWSEGNGVKSYTGANKHTKHIHISIKASKANDTSSWFPWLPKPKPLAKVKAKLSKKPKKN